MFPRLPDDSRLARQQGESTEGKKRGSPEIADLCRAFELATGWSLSVEMLRRGEPRRDELSDAELLDLLKDTEAAGNPDAAAENSGFIADRRDAERLAFQLVALMQELHEARETIWKLEAELATAVPVRRRRDEDAHLALRLEAILQGGAEAVGCQAAALYLLDEATSQLKMRACWGLPRQRLSQPARALRGAIADLEALLGHAVVIDNPAMMTHWRVPEPCSAAACVPISSPTELLGTLWVFSEHERDFSAQQTNLLEIIAGRIASELQREALLDECTRARGETAE